MSDDYTDKLYTQYVAQRVKLDAASLEAAGRYDRAVLAISSGALALSVTFIEKIAATPQQWTLFILVPGWLLLLVTIILHLFSLASSQNATSEQIRILDQQYSTYFSAADVAQAVRDGWTEPINLYATRTKKLNIYSQITLFLGIVLILTFSSINICVKKETDMATPKSPPTQTTNTKTKSIRGSYTPPTGQIPPPPPPKK